MYFSVKQLPSFKGIPESQRKEIFREFMQQTNAKYAMMIPLCIFIGMLFPITKMVCTEVLQDDSVLTRVIVSAVLGGVGGAIVSIFIVNFYYAKKLPEYLKSRGYINS